MVLILNTYPPSLDQLSLRSSLSTTSSMLCSNPRSRSTDTLEPAHSSQWSLPLSYELAASVPSSTMNKDPNRPAVGGSWHAPSHLAVNTSLRPTNEPSSMSPLSSSTLGSELCSSSDTEADEEINDPCTVVPKVEEEEEDGVIEDIKRADSSDDRDAKVDRRPRNDTGAKKKRGRPKKLHPSVPAAHVTVTKGRSKTGCRTCRRRKKKCDEAKPSCKWRSPISRSDSRFYNCHYNTDLL